MKKRNGEALTKAEIEFFVNGYTSEEIKDYQASALMMAIYFNGMTKEETAYLTDAMARSGDTVDLSRFNGLSVDKHSTGGVGDKTSLIVAPIVASLGGFVAKMSGRGLGHTGGTVDKLEAIKGYRTSLSQKEFIRQVESVGMAIIGQSGDLAPCDKKLYALRDVTATVDSIPLIVSSIMSKKIAAGSKNIVLDVKWGSGAFMKTPKDAQRLAVGMVEIGKACNRNIAAVITDMNTPLGNNIGNSLEVIEAVDVLKNNRECDLKQVSVILAGLMVSLTFKINEQEAQKKVLEAIENGSAFEKMCQWVSAQGGDASLLRNTDNFEKSEYSFDVICQRDGYISRMNTQDIGIASVLLGGGRAKKEDTIDYSAGIIINKKTGDYVKKGEVLCTLYTNKKEKLMSASEKYLSAVSFSEAPEKRLPLIYKIIR